MKNKKIIKLITYILLFHLVFLFQELIYAFNPIDQENSYIEFYMSLEELQKKLNQTITLPSNLSFTTPPSNLNIDNIFTGYKFYSEVGFLTAFDLHIYFAPQVLDIFKQSDIEIEFTLEINEKLKQPIQFHITNIIKDIIENKDTASRNFDKFINEITDIFQISLTQYQKQEISDNLFYNIKEKNSHFVRSKEGEIFFIPTNLNLSRQALEEYFLLSKYNNPEKVYKLTQSIIHEKNQVVNMRDIFGYSAFNRSPQSVYNILNQAPATSEEISYIQAKALQSAGFNISIGSIPIMLPGEGVRKITFCLYQDKLSQKWHVLSNDILNSFLQKPETTILVDPLNLRYDNPLSFGQMIKEAFPHSGIMYMIDSLPSGLSIFEYEKSASYLESLINNLERIAQKEHIEIINKEFLLNNFKTEELILAANGLQLLPKSLFHLASRVVFGANESPGWFYFPLYEGAVWVRPRFTLANLGVVIDFFRGNLDLLVEYAKSPHCLRTQIIYDLKKGETSLAKRYLNIKSRYFNSMEYGDLKYTGWFYETANRRGINYVDSKGNAGYVGY